MSNKIILKHNTGTVEKIPVLTDLEVGELAVDNITGNLYTRGVDGFRQGARRSGELVKFEGEKTLYNGYFTYPGASLVWSSFRSRPDPVTAPSDLTPTPSHGEIQAILDYAKAIAAILIKQGITKSITK